MIWVLAGAVVALVVAQITNWGRLRSLDDGVLILRREQTADRQAFSSQQALAQERITELERITHSHKFDSEFGIETTIDGDTRLRCRPDVCGLWKAFPGKRARRTV